MEYTMENFKKCEFGIACKTRKDADGLMKILHKNSITWADGMSVLAKNCWDKYGNETYYDITGGSLYYGSIPVSGQDKPNILFSEFISINKSNKEKVLDMIGVGIGEPFNVCGRPYNPYRFDVNLDLRDRDGSIENSVIFDVLWDGRKIEKIPENPNAEIKKCIELLSGSTVPVKSVIDCIRTSLTELLELKEQKSA